MKATNDWLSPNVGATNESNFNAPPAGFIKGTSFYRIGKETGFRSKLEE